MPIEVTTVYTKERLLRFQNYIAASKKALWIFSGIMTVFVLALAVLNVVLVGDFKVFLYFLLMLLLDGIYFFVYVIYPRISIRKSQSFNASVRMVFEEEFFHAQATGVLASENSTMQYSVLVRVDKKDNDLYLFIAPQRAFVVDLSSLSEEQILILKNLLQPKLKPKKFKWI